MKTDTKSSLDYPTASSARPVHSGLLKTLVGLQLFIALSGLIFSSDRWPSSSAMFALLLAMLLFSRERINDERVEHLKLKAISYGLVAGLFIASLLRTGGELLKITSFRLTLSAFEVLILILVIALALFHYWRWQDGRAEPKA